MKHTLKKATSLFLAVLLAFAISVPALAAGTEYSFAITANGSAAATVQPGEKITVALVVTKHDGGTFDLYSMQDYVHFDPAYFTLDESSIKVMTESSSGRDVDVFRASPLNFTGSGVDRIFVNRASSNGLAIPTGSMQVMTFMLTANKEGTSTLTHDTVEMLSPQVTKYSVTEQNATITIKKDGGGTPGGGNTPGGDGGTPGGGGKPPPATGEIVTEGGSTTITNEVKSEVSGSTATSTFPKDALNETVDSVLAAAKEAQTKPVVVLKVSETKNADTITASLPAASLKNLSDGSGSLVIHSENMEMTLSNGAVKALGDAGGELSISMGKNTLESPKGILEKALAEVPSFSVSATSDGKNVADFGGGSAQLSVPKSQLPGIDTTIVRAYTHEPNGELKYVETLATSEGIKLKSSKPSAIYMVVFPFKDVPVDAWYNETVAYSCLTGIMKGTATDTFDPNSATLRNMVVTVLYRLAESPNPGTLLSTEALAAAKPPFEDVPSGTWFSDAVAWAAKNNIVSGIDSKHFNPYDSISREQLVTILWRYSGSPVMADYKGLEEFGDSGKISSYANDAMKWAHKNGLVSGDGAGSILPTAFAQRAQNAAIFQRFIERVLPSL
ncbi:MAG: S-layer homology domain-containing protein [Oscillospiraceae bacterium]